MARPYIAPFGFIERLTGDGATFTLSKPNDSPDLLPNTPITVWRYSPEQLALAKIRGFISTVGYVTATFTTVEFQIDPRWPENEEILREKTPVYIALENSFEPDPGRMLTQEQANTMQNVARNYRNLRSGGPKDRASSDDPEQDT